MKTNDESNYWTCPFCHSNLDIGEMCDCAENSDDVTNLSRKGMKQKAMYKGYTDGSFVCLDDVTGKWETMNYVIYNPSKQNKSERAEMLYKHIKEGVGIELSEDIINHLIEYEVDELDKFIQDLAGILRKERKKKFNN